jgi:transforming growth factor-beta-induced protein
VQGEGRWRWGLLAILVVLLLAVTAAFLWGLDRTTDDDERRQPETVMDALDGDENLSTLAGLVRTAGLDDELAGSGPLTLFAPTNQAFAAVPAPTLDALAADTGLLEQVLLHHAIAGELRAADLAPGAYPTLRGDDVEVADVDGRLLVGGAAVIRPDVTTGNGIVHHVDAVIVPPDVAEQLAGGPTTSAPATSAPATTEAPPTTDAATTTASPTTTQPEATTTTAAAIAVDPRFEGVLADLAALPGYRTLTALLVQAEVFQLDEPATIFAPTDEAFAAVPADVVGQLDDPDNRDALIRILLNHVVGEPLVAADLATGTTVTSLEGDELAITSEGGRLLVGGARVVEADIEAGSGSVIHGIDGVLVPEDLDPTRLNEDYRVLFAPGSAVLDQAAEAVLEEAAVPVNESAGSTIALVGHYADADGEALALERAEAVRDALTARLATPDRVTFDVSTLRSAPEAGGPPPDRVSIEIPGPR